ncbi:LysR family transcriptional regulator AmpR [soil metagenome]
MQLPSVDSLRCFVEAMRHQNFRKAARAVALTPAAFGARIKQLEDQFGVELFSRTTRVVVPTQSALALLPQARSCLLAAEHCVRAASGDLGAPPMDLVLGTRHELGLSWVLPQLDALARDLPWLTLHLYFGSGPDLLLRVRTGEVDCAVTSSRFSDPKLDAVVLHREDYVFCGAKTLLGKTPFRTMADARAHVLIDSSPELPLFSYLRDVHPKARFEFKKAVHLGTIGAMRARVLDGAGVAVLPSYLVAGDLARGTLRAVLPSMKPQHDFFRLVFRTDDPRRTVFETVAESMLARPLR